MFCCCFVARTKASQKAGLVDTFCRFNNPQAPAAAQALPPPQALGSFCFPLGPENLRPKEIMRPEVKDAHCCAVLDKVVCQAELKALCTADLFLHLDRRGWQQAAWLLQVKRHAMSGRGLPVGLQGACACNHAGRLPASTVCDVPAAGVSCLPNRSASQGAPAQPCVTPRCCASSASTPGFPCTTR